MPEQRPTAALQLYLETILYKTREHLGADQYPRGFERGCAQAWIEGWIHHRAVAAHDDAFLSMNSGGVVDDMKSFLERLVGAWIIGATTIRAFRSATARTRRRTFVLWFLGHTLSIPVRNGELMLGNWQSIILAELDGPRERSVHVQVLGVSEEPSEEGR